MLIAFGNEHCFWWFKNLYRGQLFNFWSSAFLFFPQNFTPRDAHCFWQWASKNWGWVVAKSALKKFTLLPCMKVLSVEKWHLHICICSWVLAVLLSQSWTIPFFGYCAPNRLAGTWLGKNSLVISGFCYSGAISGWDGWVGLGWIPEWGYSMSTALRC